MTDEATGFLTAKAVRRMDGAIHVSGTVLAYSAHSKVECEELPKGIIGSTYVLGVNVIEGDGPMKGSPHPYSELIPPAKAEGITRVSVHAKTEKTEVEVETMPNA